jgi:hypothetical protein
MSSPRPALALVLAVLLAPAALVAAPDPVRIYKKGLSKVASRQYAFARKQLDEMLRDAYVTWRAPWKQRGGPDAPKVFDYDFSGYAEAYERYADFEEDKGKLALTLAEANTEDAAERLVETLLDNLTEIRREDQALQKSKPRQRDIHDQIPAIRRYGAWLHHDMLVQALSKLSGDEALAWLRKKGWEKAAKWDKSHKSVWGRIAIIDGIGLVGRAEDRLFLTKLTRDEDPAIRIAALEALAKPKLTPEATERLEEALNSDPSFAVRDAAWAALGESVDPAPDLPKFFGIPIDSDRVIVVLDASRETLKPVDVKLARTRTWWEWRAIAESDRTWVSQLGLAKKETSALIETMPREGRYNLVLINGANRILPLEGRGMVEADEKGKRRGEAFLAEVRDEGWAPQLQGLWEACRIAGSDPWTPEVPDDPGADTIFLVSNGVPKGGQILHGAAIVDDVRRRFRLNRIRIHTVRLDDNAAPAEEVMKGIAEATGGTYVHRTAP